MPDIEIDGATTLHYATSGAGEPILLIPGLGLDHNYYRFGIPLLSRHLQVLAVDPRGIGRSTKSPPPYTVEAWADDFAVMIDKLGRGPIHVLGSSLGGSMALALAQRHPGKLKSLIVVGGFQRARSRHRAQFPPSPALDREARHERRGRRLHGSMDIDPQIHQLRRRLCDHAGQPGEHPGQLGAKLQRIRGGAAEMGPLPAGTGTGAEIHHLAGFRSRRRHWW